MAASVVINLLATYSSLAVHYPPKDKLERHRNQLFATWAKELDEDWRRASAWWPPFRTILVQSRPFWPPNSSASSTLTFASDDCSTKLRCGSTKHRCSWRRRTTPANRLKRTASSPWTPSLKCCAAFTSNKWSRPSSPLNPRPLTICWLHPARPVAWQSCCPALYSWTPTSRVCRPSLNRPLPSK